MSGRQPRVALVSREYPPFFGGGIGTYARWIVPALNQGGVRVHVITESHDRTHPRVEVDGLTTVHRVPMGMGRGGWTNAAMRFSTNAGRVVSRLYRTGQIDVVEFAECEAAGLAHLLLQRRREDRPASVVQLHTPSEQLFVLRSSPSRTLDAATVAYFESERMALRMADAVLAPSRFIAEWAQGHYGLPERPSVIPYATPPLSQPPGPAADDGSTVVLFAGRIEPRKGVETLVRAWAGVSKEHPTARLHLAGADTSGAPDGGSMRAYLLGLLDENARARVRFLGRLGSAALRDEYARASVCVIPSLWENFPNVCIESMSSARAVLVGDQGGMREMIGESDAGLTFRAGDELDLMAKLSGLLSEPRNRLIERGRIARARIEEMCDPQRVAEQRIEHFRRVMATRHECAERQAGQVFASWRRMESMLAGVDHKFDLPKLGAGVERWVAREEGRPCAM